MNSIIVNDFDALAIRSKSKSQYRIPIRRPSGMPIDTFNEALAKAHKNHWFGVTKRGPEDGIVWCISPPWSFGKSLYIREAFSIVLNQHPLKPFGVPISSSICYRADGKINLDAWKSAVTMPKRYTRTLTGPLQRIWIEKLQQISQDDIVAEGCPSDRDQDWFVEYWNDRNPRVHRWETNPWVFVCEWEPRDIIHEEPIATL